MTLEERRNLFLRIDQLIRLRVPGSAFSLAKRLDISRSTFFRCLDEMKALGAPIDYDDFSRCYYYKEPGGFVFGYFKKREWDRQHFTRVSGGYMCTSTLPLTPSKFNPVSLFIDL
ncbi:MAG: helix-turn-helix domain-containing protein [Cytophagales bacterium]|nr:helix-turn-helix domain-containing protein [Cytophagales bacterium]